MTWDPHSSCSTRTSDAPRAFLQQMDPDKKWVPFTSTTGGGGARSIHKESKTCCSKSFQVAKAPSQSIFDHYPIRDELFHPGLSQTSFLFSLFMHPRLIPMF
jgi:hypothetical protein